MTWIISIEYHCLNLWIKQILIIIQYKYSIVSSESVWNIHQSEGRNRIGWSSVAPNDKRQRRERGRRARTRSSRESPSETTWCSWRLGPSGCQCICNRSILQIRSGSRFWQHETWSLQGHFQQPPSSVNSDSYQLLINIKRRGSLQDSSLIFVCFKYSIVTFQKDWLYLFLQLALHLRSIYKWV